MHTINFVALMWSNYSIISYVYLFGSWKSNLKDVVFTLCEMNYAQSTRSICARMPSFSFGITGKGDNKDIYKPLSPFYKYL